MSERNNELEAALKLRDALVIELKDEHSLLECQVRELEKISSLASNGVSDQMIDHFRNILS